MEAEQLQHNLRRARQLMLSAEARLRFYAYVAEAPDDALAQAKGDWTQAETLLWNTVQEREQVVRSMAVFTDAAGALTVLMEALAAGGVQSPEGPAGDSPAPVP